MEAALVWVLANPQVLLQVGAVIIAIASVVVKLTKTEYDNQVLDKVVEILHMFALNPKKSRARKDKNNAKAGLS